MSNYMSEEACKKLESKLMLGIFTGKMREKVLDEIYEIIDKAIEDNRESECDNCDQRMPSAPMYNEGML